MQNTTKVKVQLLKTLDDGSVDPNCYACKMGHVILTSDGRISSESPAVKDKQLLIKKNGKVDNRSAICKKTVDQDRTIQAPLGSSLSMTHPNTMLATRDSTETTTPGMQQGSTLSISSERKPTIHTTVSPAPSAPLSIPNTIVQPLLQINQISFPLWPQFHYHPPYQLLGSLPNYRPLRPHARIHSFHH